MKKIISYLILLNLFTSLNALIIYRPYNNGEINDVNCYLSITDENGNDVLKSNCRYFYAWYDKPNVYYSYKKSVYISGGMATHIYFKPGKYYISVYTPKDKQNGFKTNNKETWKSNTFIYDTENPLNVIFISPTADDNGFYNGGWHIDYKAPKFYKFTKPYRN